MDRRDHNNMGPRLDLGLRPGGKATVPETEPYRRQPAPPYHQQNQQADPAHRENLYPGQQVPADPYAQPGTYYDSRQYVEPEPQRNPYSAHEQSPPAGLTGAAPARQGLNRWLVWLALLLAVLALALNLSMGRTQNATTMPADNELLSGAAQERVAKLENDVGSLLLKMVTLEKDLEAVKNRAWNPAALAEINSKLTTMQKQIKDMESKLARGAASSAQAGANSGQPAASGARAGAATTSTASANAPVATSQVQERAGDKPDPLATRLSGTTTGGTTTGGATTGGATTGGATTGGASASAATPAAGQPRHTYQVQAGDTLFNIAQRYQVTTKDLMQWNNMAANDVLKVGKTLVIY